MPEDGIGAKIVRNGWRQGAILPDDLAQALVRDAPPHISVGPRVRLVLVSHDCDIARRKTTEPTVELLVSHEIDELDGQYTNAHNSRTLHVRGETQTGVVLLSADAAHRFVVPKERLLEAAPVGSLDENGMNTLSRWLSNRYRRPALPDAFNDRLGDNDQKHLRKAKKAVKRAAFRDNVRGVYVRMNPAGEARPNQSYAVDLVAVVPKEVEADERVMGEILAAFGSLEAAINGAPHIHVRKGTVVPDDKFTMRDQISSKRLDFDYLSLADGDDPPPD